MRVFGTVKDAVTEMPLPGAKIRLFIREKELAVLHSDSEGKFEHKEAAQYIGEILTCKVEKEGYALHDKMQEFEQDEVLLAINLYPLDEEKIDLTFNLKDKKRNPLEGVKVSLELDGEEVGVGLSDKHGIFKISFSYDFKDKTTSYKAELGGFEFATGKVQLKKETSIKITMKRPPVPPPDGIWLLKVVAGIAAVVSFSIIISLLIGTPNPPDIQYFDASLSAIISGQSSTLRWETTNAEVVEISGLGRVASTGTRAVSPTGTTTYTLTATNEAGRRDAIVLVTVGPGRPEIKYFEATQGIDREYILRWGVSGATSVTIDHGIGNVASTGTRAVYPTETTTYLLTATNEAGIVIDTVEVIVVPVVTAVLDKPVINYFEVTRGIDREYILRWGVSDATSVTIDHGIGSVASTDTRVVSPPETTTYYTLKATNEAGSVDATAEVRIEVQPPE